MRWRLIQDDYHDAYTNMAIDEVLLQSNIPVLRFYRWRPPAISVGYFQRLEEEIDLEECKRQGIDYVRRITGGKAVLHDKELTYSFVISQDLMPKSIIESYKVISRAILIALESLGLKPAMNPAPLNKDRVNTKRCGVKEKVDRIRKSPLCFNDPSYYEIVVNGKKIVGSAQVRKKGKILQHGSILIDFDIEKMCSLFKTGNRISQVQKRVTSLNNELRKEIEFKDLAFALRKGFEENFAVRLIPDELTRKESILAQEIAATKFSTKEWNHLR
ncbi:lipoate--protein ligase family protein [bacterium]|nr:lipoate--protein ligase family protein [bacterium]MCG2676297.1 lipoate--protein ligase family protein [bacterium]